MPEQPLQGKAGITSLSGQVVETDGRGLPNVQISMGISKAQTDDKGRFLLSYVIPGLGVLEIDGRHAGPKADVDFGFYEARVEARPGQTTVLPFKSWLPRLDRTHEVSITSPTKTAVTITTPNMPGLEIHVPAGTVIKDADGAVVRRIGITTMPIDRTPVPVPEALQIQQFYTVQPGASCLYDATGGIGTASMAFPNSGKELPKARMQLWRYEPDANGWTAYGFGTVSSDGSRINAEADSVLTDFDSGECDPQTHTRRPPPDRPEPIRHRGTR